MRTSPVCSGPFGLHCVLDGSTPVLDGFVEEYGGGEAAWVELLIIMRVTNAVVGTSMVKTKSGRVQPKDGSDQRR